MSFEVSNTAGLSTFLEPFTNFLGAVLNVQLMMSGICYVIVLAVFQMQHKFRKNGEIFENFFLVVTCYVFFFCGVGVIVWWDARSHYANVTTQQMQYNRPAINRDGRAAPSPSAMKTTKKKRKILLLRNNSNNRAVGLSTNTSLPFLISILIGYFIFKMSLIEAK